MVGLRAWASVDVGRATAGDEPLELGDGEPDASADTDRRDDARVDQLVERRPSDTQQPRRLLRVDEQRPQADVAARCCWFDPHRSRVHTSVRESRARARGTCAALRSRPRRRGRASFTYHYPLGARFRCVPLRRSRSQSPIAGSAFGAAITLGRFTSGRSIRSGRLRALRGGELSAKPGVLGLQRVQLIVHRPPLLGSSVVGSAVAVEVRPRPVEFALGRQMSPTFGL